MDDAQLTTKPYPALASPEPPLWPGDWWEFEPLEHDASELA